MRARGESTSLKKILNPVTKKILSGVVIASVVVFFWQTLSANWHRLQNYSVTLNVQYIWSLLLFAIAVVTSGFLAGLVLRGLQQKEVDLNAAMFAHLGSWLVRYIPSVAQPMFKMNWAAQRAISRAVGLLGFLYEFAFMQLASIVGSVAIILMLQFAAFTDSNVVPWSIGLFISGAMAILALRYLVNPIAVKYSKMRKLESTAQLPVMTWGWIFSLMAGFTIPRLINGFAIIIVAMDLVPGMSIETAAVIAATYTIASAIGVLWVFVPSGIGVREAIFLLLAAAVGVDLIDAIVISVVVRLVSTLSDLVVGAAYGSSLLLTKANGPRREV